MTNFKKTLVLTAAAGLALGCTFLAFPADARPVSMDSPMMGEDKADLTPRFKAGDKYTFKQHTVRKDTMTVGNMAPPEAKPDPKAEPGKDGKPADAKPSDGKEVPKPAGGGAPPAVEKPPAGIQQNANGMSQTTSVDQTATFELRVIDASETGAELELELKHITASMEQGNDKAKWNSDTPPDDKDQSNPVLKSYRPIVGAVAKIKLNADGSIASIAQDPRLDFSKPVTLAAHVQQLVSADGIRLRWASVIWPRVGRTPTKVDETWQNTGELLFRQVGKFTFITDSKLKSVADGAAQIASTGEVRLGAMPDGQAAAGKLKEQSLSAQTVWDTKAGMVKSQKWDQRTVLDINAMGIPVMRTSEFTVTTTRE